MLLFEHVNSAGVTSKSAAEKGSFGDAIFHLVLETGPLDCPDHAKPAVKAHFDVAR